MTNPTLFSFVRLTAEPGMTFTESFMRAGTRMVPVIFRAKICPGLKARIRSRIDSRADVPYLQLPGVDLRAQVGTP
jgi:hypothetical protein